MYHLVYSYGPGKEKKHILAFLTLHYFNDKITEGHKVLSDRIINAVGEAFDWNILVMSLERKGSTNSKNDILYQEIMPQYVDLFIHMIKALDVLKSMNVDVLHILAYNKIFPAFLNKIINMKRLKIVAHLFYHPIAFRDPRYFPIKLLSRLRMFDAIITTSRALKEYLLKDLSLSGDSIYLIPPLIPESFFQFDYPSSRVLAPQIKRKYGLNETDFIVTYIGHIIPQRGIFELITAFREAIKSNSSLRLVISHSNIVFKDFSVDYLTLLKRIITKYGLQNRVILLGKQDLRTLYTLSDILFFGFREGFYFTYPPLVVCEAMAAGIPFILRSSPLVRELFVDTPPIPVYNNTDELATILCSLPDKGTSLCSFSKTLKGVALSNYHPYNTVSKLLRIYYKLV
jgi:glycosyltransferase involved in cell wall biosynthesis